MMEKMVTLLYEKETIFKEDVEALFEGASVESILAKDKAADAPSGVVIVEEPRVEKAEETAAPEAPAGESEEAEKPSDDK